MAEYHVQYTTGPDGWITARVSELPAAISQGRTMEEARTMIADAIKEVLACYRERTRTEPGVWETVQVEV